MGGKMWVIPTGCTGVVESGGVLNVESGGELAIDSGAALSVNGIDYISTDGKFVNQYANVSTAATVLTNYGVSYVGGTTTSDIKYYLPTGTANVEKTIVALANITTGAIEVTSSGCQISNSTGAIYTKLTIDAYGGAAVTLIAQGSTQWCVISKTTGVTVS
jgi:actin-like ATPase involved in cell morphogenesis